MAFDKRLHLRPLITFIHLHVQLRWSMLFSYISPPIVFWRRRICQELSTTAFTKRNRVQIGLLHSCSGLYFYLWLDLYHSDCCSCGQSLLNAIFYCRGSLFLFYANLWNLDVLWNPVLSRFIHRHAYVCDNRGNQYLNVSNPHNIGWLNISVPPEPSLPPAWLVAQPSLHTVL